MRTGMWAVITRSRYRTARLLAGAALSLTACFVAQPLTSVRAATLAPQGKTVAGALRQSPAISQVLADTPIGASAPAAPALGPAANIRPVLQPHGVAPASEFCGTRAQPELGPEALQVVHATPTETMGADGAGVTVAFLADGIDPSNADFVRNRAYGPQGARVIVHYQDFSGDGTQAKTAGGEAFGDASSPSTSTPRWPLSYPQAGAGPGSWAPPQAPPCWP
jgi:hypothetical protein